MPFHSRRMLFPCSVSFFRSHFQYDWQQNLFLTTNLKELHVHRCSPKNPFFSFMTIITIWTKEYKSFSILVRQYQGKILAWHLANLIWFSSTVYDPLCTTRGHVNSEYIPEIAPEHLPVSTKKGFSPSSDSSLQEERNLSIFFYFFLSRIIMSTGVTKLFMVGFQSYNVPTLIPPPMLPVPRPLNSVSITGTSLLSHLT